MAGEVPLPSTAENAERLYNQASELGEGKLIMQHEFQKVDPLWRDAQLLGDTINRLLIEGLFKLHAKDGLPCVKVVSRADAAKHQDLTDEESLVFNLIEASGREGAWTRTIQKRSNLHTTVVNKCLKQLETKGLAKQIKSSKHPTRKLYILSTLQPAEDITGGSFFDNGVIDEQFVQNVALLIEEHVASHSWTRVRRQVPLEPGADPNARPKTKSVLLPKAHNFVNYPTLGSITSYINTSQISKIRIKEAEISQLLEILEWEGRILKIVTRQREVVFKTPKVSLVDEDVMNTNGLTEAPCGRCPVFDLCEEGGPVNPKNCVYFKEWLDS